MRPYQASHPWLTFRFELPRLSMGAWRLLGEAESKCEHLAGVPLRPEVALRLHQIYLTKGVHGTTSIEGNTLSEAEVLARVQGDLPLPPSRAYLGTEIDNVVRACNAIVEDVISQNNLGITVAQIRQFNKDILSGLPLDDDVHPGELRTHSVVVANYRGAPAEDCEYLLERLCAWLERDLVDPTETGEYRYCLAIVKAILAHLYLAWIHPFGDGNGRTARLVEFKLLVAAGVPVPAAHVLSDHYNRTRDVTTRCWPGPAAAGIRSRTSSSTPCGAWWMSCASRSRTCGSSNCRLPGRTSFTTSSATGIPQPGVARST